MDDCHVNATCSNTFGSFECTCDAGFVGNGVNCTSKTYNGCASGRKILVATSTKAHPLCTNLVDTTWNVLFTILVLRQQGCYQPFVSFPLLYILLLTDVDECELDTDNCHANATCADVIGSFDCTCNSGFEGDGVICTSKKFLCILQKGVHVLKSCSVVLTVCLTIYQQYSICMTL